MLSNKIKCVLLLIAAAISLVPIIKGPRSLFSINVTWYQPTIITHFSGHSHRI